MWFVGVLERSAHHGGSVVFRLNREQFFLCALLYVYLSRLLERDQGVVFFRVSVHLTATQTVDL